jgi:hypothetical protein
MKYGSNLYIQFSACLLRYKDPKPASKVFIGNYTW